MRNLVIAEKPSVGRDIAKVLGCKSKKSGYLYSEEYVVSWAIGHLVTLCEPEDYNPNYKKWRGEHLPIVPAQIQLKAITNTKSQFEILKNLMLSEKVESIICATDSGREGELIFRYIYELVGCKKPVKRLWISSMTDEAITDGFSKLKPSAHYDNLYSCAKSRSEADWLVGINATRAFTLRYNTLLSIGRVQTPTLAMIVERQREIDAFVSTPYWEIKATFGHTMEYTGMWFDPKTKDTKILDANNAKAIVEKVKGKKSAVTSAEKAEKKQPPPLLYDLTELQRDANRQFGFAAKKTLDIAQDLYEKKKMITYPRTDSRYLSSDMLSKCRSILKSLSEQYGEFVSAILALEKLPVTKRIADDSKVTDHHAIIPTGKSATLTGEEQQLYNLIAKRFVAVFLPYHIYEATTVITSVQDEHFISKGNTIVSWGWMALYKQDNTDETETLPDLQQNTEVTLNKAELLKKKTQPPKPYTEATLLSAMENAGRFVEDEGLKEQLKESGLGTPATRAAIIERLLQVGYIVRNKKNLTPTEKGMKLIEVVPHELKSPETTGKWERGLTSISKGKMEPKKFMASITRYVHFIIDASKKADRGVQFPLDGKKG